MKPFPVLCLCSFSFVVATRAGVPADAPPVRLDPLVVTTAATADQPLTAIVDPKAAIQPVPAQDGADVLKTIPGFAVSRKGGADGEAILRGQAGSRLDLLLDGESALGGCPHRMDPPTAYIFPATFDRVTVIKGPQSVRYGPGNSAGVVLFERDLRRFAAPGATLEATATIASFGRDDESATARTGTPDVYAQLSGSRAESDDYEDGDGHVVHSHYHRSSAQAALGWTPDDHTLLEVSGTLSRGEAAYGYSSMDATKLDRENLGVRFRRTDLSPLVTKLEAQAYVNAIDHVMDNYTLRPFTPSMMMPAPAASHPDHRLIGGRVLAELALTGQTTLAVGGDFQDGRHRSRSSMNEPAMPYETMPRVADAAIADAGIFAEATHALPSGDRLIAGARLDRWSAEDKRATIAGMMNAVPNPTAGEQRVTANPAGFARYEHDFAAGGATSYLGVGHTERAPDYWELITNESSATKSSFHTRAEKTTQLDAGVNLRRGPLSASVAAFANTVDDYILVQTGVPKTSGMMTSLVTVTRNVDATSCGGEASLGYALTEAWKLDASLAYVAGRNRTDDLPLAQQPPLEGRIGFAYTAPGWTAGALARFVAAQDRYALNQGTIVGQDLGPTGGFAVYSLNAGWRIHPRATLTAGIDNVFDKTYAEHLSRNGGAVTGYPATMRVNEPGRTFWLRVALDL